MEPCTGLSQAAPQGEPVEVLQMEILRLQRLVAELLLKNQHLRLAQPAGQAITGTRGVVSAGSP